MICLTKLSAQVGLGFILLICFVYCTLWGEDLERLRHCRFCFCCRYVDFRHVA